ERRQARRGQAGRPGQGHQGRDVHHHRRRGPLREPSDVGPARGGRQRPLVLRRALLERRGPHRRPAARGGHPELQRHLDLHRRRGPARGRRGQGQAAVERLGRGLAAPGAGGPGGGPDQGRGPHRRVLGHPRRHRGVGAELRQGEDDRTALRGHGERDRPAL
ncbi:MAG: hypothetical protein AVDCRST_MAG48-2830, partial [uncultured Friedmanniella sp.]